MTLRSASQVRLRVCGGGAVRVQQGGPGARAAAAAADRRQRRRGPLAPGGYPARVPSGPASCRLLNGRLSSPDEAAGAARAAALSHLPRAG